MPNNEVILYNILK